MTVMCGGFGLCGIPENLILALCESGVRGLTVVSNNAGVDQFGLGKLLKTRQIAQDDFVLRRREQGVRAAVPGRRAASWSSIRRARSPSAFAPAARASTASTRKTGAGTLVAEGKEQRVVNGETYVLETGLTADLSLVKAWKGDTRGQPRLSQDRAQLQSDDGHRRPRHGRRSRAAGRGRRARSRRHPHARHLRAADHPGRELPEDDRASHRAQAHGCSPEVRPITDMPWTREQLAAARRTRAARRLLRQSRHRHPDAGRELHSGRHEGRAAVGERHARHGPVSVRGRGGSGSDQRRQADDHASCRSPRIFRRRTASG